MRNKLKYTATVLLLVVCTAAVMVFPFFYYNSSDAAMEKNVRVNTLGFSVQNEQLTCREAYYLMLSDDSTQMVLSNNTVARDDIVRITEKALKDLISDCEKESAFYFLLNYFLSRLDRCTFDYNLSLTIGELAGDAASMTIADVTVNFYDEDIDAYESYDDYVLNGNVTLYMHMNYSNAQMYNMSVEGVQKISSEYDDYYCSLDAESRYKADIANDGSYAIKYLVDYWDVPEEWVVIEEYERNIIFTVQPTEDYTGIPYVDNMVEYDAKF